MTNLSGYVSGTRSGSQCRGRIGVPIGFGGIPRPVPTRPVLLSKSSLKTHVLFSLNLLVKTHSHRSISNAFTAQRWGWGK